MKVIELLPAAFAGLLAGVVYFSLLWYQVRALHRLRHPALAMAAGLMIRLALVVGVLYLVGREAPQAMLSCACGIIVGRMLVLRATRNTRPHPPQGQASEA
ncbi:MAG: ATP synthase subunit I [Gammaproteobacteria bacterium]|nr:ATP synthase subunit I [Gammaproteobacteria bacterium]